MGISDLEAVLFSAAKPISIDVIQDIFKLSKQDSLTLIDHLASDLESHKAVSACESLLLVWNW